MITSRRRFAVIVSALLTSSAAAAERPLKGDEINALLNGNTVVGVSAGDKSEWKQYFYASGETVYRGGTEPPSSGNWQVKGDQFCSQWPPRDGWSCYDVTGDLDATPRTITWISGGGTKYPGAVHIGKQM